MSEEGSDLPPLLIDFNDGPSEQQAKVPVTLLTGFLGAGKTTFLNYILTQNHGKRIAVVQNEFGEELGIERALLMGKNDEKVQEWMELPNGCICCTVRDELVLTLEALIQRRDRFNYIFIETTGMADPGPLATSLWLDEDLGSALYLDSIITIVDAKNLLYHLNKRETKIETYNEAQKQIAFADLLIVNKTDLVTDKEIQVLTDTIKTINIFAPYILTQRSVVSLDDVLDIKAYDANKLDSNFNKLDKIEQNDIHHHHHHHHAQESDVKAFSIKIEGDCKSKKDLETWLGKLMWEKSYEIYRIKGEIAIMNDEYRYIVQGVHDNFEISQTDFKWTESTPSPTLSTSEKVKEKNTFNKKINHLVLIGKHLPIDEFEQSFIEDVLVKIKTHN